MKIHVLDDSLITKIAAGEVIERPASIVKELIENSLDAGADEIKIEVDGLNKIRISDNGSGMSEEDAMLSFKRHATSKIIKEEDIFNITSLGFRGEALASIAEISNFTIMTNEKDIGVKIEIEGGRLQKQSKVGMPKGTIIEVRDLFFNVPARKNFLKSEITEHQEIVKVVENYALISNISFRLIKNGEEILNVPKGELIDNITNIYGAEVARDMVKVEGEVEGYVSKPLLTRGSRVNQHIYINGRHVKNETITNAVYEGYDTFLFVGRHPIFVLNLNIDPKEIDVNVHPAKREVRLKREEKIREIVKNAVYSALKKENLVIQATVEKETEQQPIKQYEFTKDIQSVLEAENVTKVKDKPIERRLGPFRIMGQVNRTYVVAESPKGLAIIDQHAVHERINYERFMRQFKDNAVRKQKLVTSKTIELNPHQYMTALGVRFEMGKLGFEYSDFGNNTIKLDTVPEIFGNLKSTSFIDVLNELKQGFTQEITEKIVMKSCKASIKAGEELTIPQLQVLMDELETVENPYNCPHGRPTIIELSVADLEKKFKRSGW
ncbi:DNA mismatch repair endonuclease MutL [Candidatus Woesearchaeota archaeon]|nr:DNA mismatch repair endonuclease MutL [Candidatus Woesearchaeota archaeon]